MCTLFYLLLKLDLHKVVLFRGFLNANFFSFCIMSIFHSLNSSRVSFLKAQCFSWYAYSIHTAPEVECLVSVMFCYILMAQNDYWDFSPPSLSSIWACDSFEDRDRKLGTKSRFWLAEWMDQPQKL